MTSSSPSWLKETPLHFEEIARYHVPLTIYLPAIDDNGDSQTLSPDRYDFSREETDNDALEGDYQWKSLPQDSGIYNPRISFPRSLLWRTISGGTLTIHCVDTIRTKLFPRNRSLTAMDLRFPVKIRPNCVGFSDWSSKTTLYVLTEDCVLYAIPISGHFFLGENRSPEAVLQNTLAHRPLFLQARFGQGKLALDVPHFMYVLPNSHKVIFVMQDGSLHQYDPFGSLFKP
jgi:hypothetical protein